MNWITVPKQFFQIKADEASGAAIYYKELYNGDRTSYGYRRGEMAQALADLFQAIADTIPPKGKE